MKTPDITPAQIVAALTALVTACVVLFKLNLTEEQQAAAITVIGTIVPIAWILADGLGIRPGRAKVVAAQHLEAAAQLQNLPADGDDSLVPPAK